MKSIKLPENVGSYLDVFDERIKSLNESISNFDNNIKDCKSKIKTNERKGKDKNLKLDNKRSQINTKLHEVSGDYKINDLLNAAENLRKIEEEREDYNEIISAEIDVLNDKLSIEEYNKKSAQEVKSVVENIKKVTESKLKEAYSVSKSKIDAITSALEVCDNSNLSKALEEENKNMNRTLEEIYNEGKKELDKNKVKTKDSAVKSNTKSKSSMGEIKFKEEKKEVIKPIILDELPKFSEIKEEKIIPIETEELKIEKTEPTITKEDIYESTREVINKVDATKKASMVKGSEQVRKSIKKFFKKA